ncbi:MAG: methyltransferase [Paracoccaceae bacterium]
MSRLEFIRLKATYRDIFQGQFLHVGLVILLVLGALSLLPLNTSGAMFLAWTARDWAICSIYLAVIHQVIVAIVFRLELYKGFMTRLFGDQALKIWGLIFLPLLIARPLTITIVGWLDSTPISGARNLEIAVGTAFILCAVLTMHSVIKYFTLRRAIGADHFDDEVIAMPFVKEGVFRYTSNAMYGFAFLGLWGIALVFGSWDALVVAFFQHVYIWVHLILTEQPDIDRIYGRKAL